MHVTLLNSQPDVEHIQKCSLSRLQRDDRLLLAVFHRQLRVLATHTLTRSFISHELTVEMRISAVPRSESSLHSFNPSTESSLTPTASPSYLLFNMNQNLDTNLIRRRFNHRLLVSA